MLIWKDEMSIIFFVRAKYLKIGDVIIESFYEEGKKIWNIKKELGSNKNIIEIFFGGISMHYNQYEFIRIIKMFDEEKQDISIMIGKTIKRIEGAEKDSEHITFITDKEKFILYHNQDCCENVLVEDVCGDIDDLLNAPILMAEEVFNLNFGEHEEYESSTWTFYKLATIRGYVTIRWLGTSNGYYSENVDFKIEGLE